MRLPVFVAELHLLTRSEAFHGPMGRDEGWNCRTQAFLVALVASALHLKAAVLHGRAAFVLGPTTHDAPSALDVQPHAWAAIEGGGVLDLSPRFETVPEQRMAEWGAATAFGQRLLPSGQLILARTPFDFETALAAGSHESNGRTAVYLANSLDDITASRVLDGFQIGNSLLADKLAEKYDASILCKAARHLFDLTYEKVPSLRVLDQDKAWAKLDLMKVDAVAWLKARMHANN